MLIIGFSFCFGLIFGSFISLITHRIPKSQNIFITRSKCAKCGHILSILDLVPLLSWLCFGGKCRYCHKEISIRYPLTEVFTGFMFALIVILFGVNHLSFLLVGIAILLITISIIDFEYYIIPDSLQIVFLFFAGYWAWFFNYDISKVILNLTIGFLSAFSIMAIFKYLRKKDGLGFGDVKFIGIATIFFGYENLVIFYLFSGMIGVVNGLAWQYILKKALFPFAPSLCVSFFFCLIIPYFFGNSWYMDVNLLDIIVSKILL